MGMGIQLFLGGAVIGTIFTLFLNQYFGIIAIQVTGQTTIDSLSNQLSQCNTRLSEKCPTCPEVKCDSNYGLPVFLSGLGFGALLGILLYNQVNKVWREELEKSSKKGRKA